jgi:hypothetical protein
MKDKILIPLVLTLYIGVLAFIGAITSLAQTMWTQINTITSTPSSPHGIFCLLAGICVLLYIVSKRRSESV